MKTNKITKLAALASVAMLGLSILMPFSQAQTVPTVGGGDPNSVTVSQTTAGGSLTLALPSTSWTADATTQDGHTHTFTNSLTGIRVTDTRGTGAGWSLTSTSTHMGLKAANVTKIGMAGNAASLLPSVSVAGIYDGTQKQVSYANSGAVNSGTMAVRVASVDGNGMPATIQVIAPGSSTLQDAEAVSNNAVTKYGLTITFGTGTYAEGDAFGFNVNHYDYTGLTTTSSNLAAVAAEGDPTPSLDNVVLNTAATAYSVPTSGDNGTSSSKTEVSAAPGAGLGIFTFDEGSSWLTPAYAMAGDYQGTITYTLQ